MVSYLIEKVLVVDSTRINRIVASEQLTKLDVTRDLAESGAEFLMLATERSCGQNSVLNETGTIGREVYAAGLSITN